MTVAAEPTETTKPPIPLASDALRLANVNKPVKEAAKKDEEAREQQKWFDGFYDGIPANIQHAIDNGWSGTQIPTGSFRFTNEQYSQVKALLEPMGYTVRQDYMLKNTCNGRSRYQDSLVIYFSKSTNCCTIL